MIVNRQEFEATPDQTEFVVTEFGLTSKYMVSIDGVLTMRGHYRSLNKVTFDVGLAEGVEVIIIN